MLVYAVARNLSCVYNWFWVDIEFVTDYYCCTMMLSDELLVFGCCCLSCYCGLRKCDCIPQSS